MVNMRLERGIKSLKVETSVMESLSESISLDSMILEGFSKCKDFLFL